MDYPDYMKVWDQEEEEPIEKEESNEEEILKEKQEKYIYLNYWSFTPKPIRRLTNYIVSSLAFKFFILLTIVVNLIVLSARDPLDKENKTKRNQVLFYIDLACLIVFTIEMVLKIISFGVVFHKKAYFRSGWDCLDAFIVFMGWISYIEPQSRALLAIRSLRVLKPLRAITMFPLMMRFLLSAFHSIPYIVCVGLLIIIFFLFFSLLGVVIFNGSLRYHCIDDITGEFDSYVTCNPHGESFLGGYECPSNQSCKRTNENPLYGFINFDNIGYGLLSVFILVNFDGFLDYYYLSMDATNKIAGFYYVFVVLTGGYIWVNLLLTVISVAMSTKMEILQESPKSGKVAIPHYYTIIAVFKKIFKKIKKFMKRDRSNFVYRICKKIVKNRFFEGFFIVLIFINVIILAMPYRNQPESYTMALFIMNSICLIFFTVELFLQLTAVGIWKYFKKKLNYIDVFVVIAGWTEIILYVMGVDADQTSIIRVLRFLRY